MRDIERPIAGPEVHTERSAVRWRCFECRETTLVYSWRHARPVQLDRVITESYLRGLDKDRRT